MLTQVTEQVEAADKQARRLAMAHPVCPRLMTVPGVGPITSLRFDPDEDRGARNWIIDWVRLGSDRPFGSLDVVTRAANGASVGGDSKNGSRSARK